MKIKDQFRTGWRNLNRQKLRTSLTVFAIVIGAVSVTVMLSLVTSAKSFLTSSSAKTGEDRRIAISLDPTADYESAMHSNNDSSGGNKLDDAIVSKVSTLEHVASATPIASWWGYKTATSTSGQMKMDEVQTRAYVPNGTVKYEVAAGRLLSDADDNGAVIVSTEVAHALGFPGTGDAAIGQKISLEPRGDMGPPDMKLPTPSVTIVGVFVADGKQIDATLNLAKASLIPSFTQCKNGPENNGQNNGGGQNQQPVCDTQNQLTQRGYDTIFIQVDSKKNVDVVVADIKRLGLGAGAGKEQVAKQNRAFTIVGAVLGGIGGIALLVAAIGVINTMVMATLERTREIGIMRALGATKRTIRRLFTIEAGVLGFLGGLVGVAFSFAVMLLLNKVVNNQLSRSGVTARNVMHVPPALALVVIAGTTAIGMLAGRLPARRAANLDPVEALRHE